MTSSRQPSVPKSTPILSEEWQLFFRTFWGPAAPGKYIYKRLNREIDMQDHSFLAPVEMMMLLTAAPDLHEVQTKFLTPYKSRNLQNQDAISAVTVKLESSMDRAQWALTSLHFVVSRGLKLPEYASRKICERQFHNDGLACCKPSDCTISWSHIGRTEAQNFCSSNTTASITSVTM